MYQPRSVEMANAAGKNDSQTVTIFKTEGYDRVKGQGSMENDAAILAVTLDP